MHHIATTEGMIERLEKQNACIEVSVKKFQEERAERAFEITKEEDEEILEWIDECWKRYKENEKAIEQLELERAGA